MSAKPGEGDYLVCVLKQLLRESEEKQDETEHTSGDFSSPAAFQVTTPEEETDGVRGLGSTLSTLKNPVRMTRGYDCNLR